MSSSPLSRAERAHWRLTWQQRLARNARPPTAPPVEITIYGLSAVFAQTWVYESLELIALARRSSSSTWLLPSSGSLCRFSPPLFPMKHFFCQTRLVMCFFFSLSSLSPTFFPSPSAEAGQTAERCATDPGRCSPLWASNHCVRSGAPAAGNWCHPGCDCSVADPAYCHDGVVFRSLWDLRSTFHSFSDPNQSEWLIDCSLLLDASGSHGVW